MVGSQAIIGDVIPPRQRGRYMGYFGAVFGLSSILGPLAGGWFTQHVSWRWIFYINVPIGIVALFTIARVLHIPVRKIHHKIDWWGTTLLSAGVVGLILVTTWGGTTYAWGSGIIVGISIASVVAARDLLRRRIEGAEPIIPLSLFKNRTFNVASVVGFVIGFTMFGSIVYLPLYLQIVHGASPTLSGLELLPMVAGMLITFVVSGQLVSRTGRYRIFPIVGLARRDYRSRRCWHDSERTRPMASPPSACSLSASASVSSCRCSSSRCRTPCRTPSSAPPRPTPTFFRTIGGAFGVAILGAVFNTELLDHLRATVPAVAAQAHRRQRHLG